MAKESGLHYRVAGEGPPLLLLHGFTVDGSQWDPYVPHFAENYTTIVPDLPGHGRSEPGPDPYRFDHVAKDMFALMDELGGDRFRAMGHSVGAIILTHMAIQEPARIESLVLDGLAAFREPSMLLNFPRFEDYSAKFRDYWLTLHPGGEAQVRRLLASMHHLAEYVEEVYIPPEKLSGLQARTLIVLGDRDSYLPVDLAVEMYHAIPSAALWIVPAVGHTAVWPQFGGSTEASSIFPSVATKFLGTEPLGSLEV